MPAFFPALAAAGLLRGAAGTAINALRNSPGAVALAGAATRTLPGIGMIAGGTAAGSFLTNALSGAPRKRRRGRGFTARDLSQFKKMSKMINELQGCMPKRKCR